MRELPAEQDKWVQFLRDNPKTLRDLQAENERRLKELKADKSVFEH
jgi:hypothetical protein